MNRDTKSGNASASHKEGVSPLESASSESLVRAIHAEFHEKDLDRLVSVQRTAEIKRLDMRATSVIGVRRCGKTFLLYREIQKLKEQGVPDSSILCVNFEDDRLLPMDQRGLGRFLDAFYALHPENHDRETWLFLDEIQNVAGWPAVIRRYLDTKKARIYLTGSSSKMLSTEIATSLRGRAHAHHAWPFDFREYLRATAKEDVFQQPSPRGTDLRLKSLNAFLRSGGFPEIVRAEPALRRELLQNYVEVILTRDVADRHGIERSAVLKLFVNFLLQHTAQLLSVNSYFNHLKSLGHKVSKNTLYDYLSYFEDCFFVFPVPLHSRSAKKAQNNPKKIYTIDPGLAAAYQFGSSENLGRLFENLVFIDLKRGGLDVAYYRTRDEKDVDFVCRSPKTGKTFLIQACYEILSAETERRENEALAAAKKELQVEGRVVTRRNYADFLIWLDRMGS